MIIVNDQVAIPEDELTLTASRSGGPGGQNVNKVSSKITLAFDVEGSGSLTADQKIRIQSKLATRINKEGVLRVVSQRTRSQELNREDAIEVFAELLRQALHVDRRRVKTKIPRGVRERRLEEKKERKAIKQSRTKKDWD